MLEFAKAADLIAQTEDVRHEMPRRRTEPRNVRQEARTVKHQTIVSDSEGASQSSRYPQIALEAGTAKKGGVSPRRCSPVRRFPCALLRRPCRSLDSPGGCVCSTASFVCSTFFGGTDASFVGDGKDDEAAASDRDHSTRLRRH